MVMKSENPVHEFTDHTPTLHEFFCCRRCFLDDSTFVLKIINFFQLHSFRHLWRTTHISMYIQRLQ
jgi:hypothetical protein